MPERRERWFLFGEEEYWPSKAALRRIERALAELGECGDAAEVALFLAERGIRGRPGDCAACPVAVYLQQALRRSRRPKGASPWRLEVGREAVTVFARDRTFPSVTRASARLLDIPRAVQDFILEFDTGEHRVCAA